jgi:hypothetical protein
MIRQQVHVPGYFLPPTPQYPGGRQVAAYYYTVNIIKFDGYVDWWRWYYDKSEYYYWSSTTLTETSYTVARAHRHQARTINGTYYKELKVDDGFLLRARLIAGTAEAGFYGWTPGVLWPIADCALDAWKYYQEKFVPCHGGRRIPPSTPYHHPGTGTTSDENLLYENKCECLMLRYRKLLQDDWDNGTYPALGGDNQLTPQSEHPGPVYWIDSNECPGFAETIFDFLNLDYYHFLGPIDYVWFMHRDHSIFPMKVVPAPRLMSAYGSGPGLDLE